MPAGEISSLLPKVRPNMSSAEVINRYREFAAPSAEIDAYLLDLPLDGTRAEVQIKAELLSLIHI